MSRRDPVTIGRRVYYWPSIDDISHGDMRRIWDAQPFDAGVVGVHNAALINLQVSDHRADVRSLEGVPFKEEATDEEKVVGGFATWMPYQSGQRAKTEEVMASQAVPAPAPVPETVPGTYPYHTHEFAMEVARAARDVCVNKEGGKTIGSVMVDAYLNTLDRLNGKNKPDPLATTATKVYTDGTTATGPGQLPDQSPAQQASSGIGGAVSKARDYLKTIVMGAEEAQELATAIGNVSKGPRVTIEQINATIRGEHYFTAAEGASAFGGYAGSSEDYPALQLLTICVLVLQNGFTVLGKSACADPANFNASIGQRIARDDAVSQCWALLGYELKTALQETRDVKG